MVSDASTMHAPLANNYYPSGGDRQTLSRDTLVWVLISQAIAVLPLLIILPKWLIVLWILLVLWRVQIYRGRSGFPSRTIKYFFAFVAVTGLVLTYGASFSVEPLVAFLVVAFSLKLCELRYRSDAILVLNICYLAIATVFLFEQTILAAAYGLMACVFFIAALMGLFRLRKISMLAQLRRALILLAQSIPVMLLLFIFMPRMGQLWQVPLNPNGARTGFSDSLSPGDFSQLSRSNDVAFRVSFTQPLTALGDKSVGTVNDANAQPNHAAPVALSELYWRGLVFDEFDGRRWQRSPMSQYYDDTGKKRLALQRDGDFSDRGLRYDVLLEPHHYPWLFSLDSPYQVQSPTLKVGFTHDDLLRSSMPVAARSQYAVQSASRHPDKNALPKRWLRLYVRLPDKGNDRARALAQRWLASVSKKLSLQSERSHTGVVSRAMIEQALQFYRQSFSYTLRPPRLGQNSVDDFLFGRQRGFCEHFASSFVFLMRAAGIPARLVVGYQGGEWNAREAYYLIRQSDAHAWAEVWVEGSGWLRVDPTSAVAPSRIELGLDEALDAQDAALVGSWLTASSGPLYALQLRLDAMKYSWHRWVLGYDKDRQQQWFKRQLGGAEPWRIAMVLTVVVGFAFAIYLLQVVWGGRKRYHTPLDKLYARYLAIVARAGMPLRGGETPMQFAQRVARAKPLWREQVLAIARLYVDISYTETQVADARAKSLRRQLRQLIRQLR